MVIFIAILFAGLVFAGFIGSLTGLGGGVVIVPLLTIGFGVDIRYAIGTSLISVIATSSGAASAYVREGILNIRIGMFLEIATTLGAIAGAGIAVFAPTHAIAVIFGLVLLYSAIVSFQKRKGDLDTENLPERKPNRIAELLKARGTYSTTDGLKKYTLQHLGGGFTVMSLAGILSGLLGIGSGALKVIAMDSIMKIPFKVSTSTSNFMIGVTAAASAGIYLNRGYIDPVLSMPVMVGVLIGSLVGAKFLIRSRTKSIRIIFAIVITLLAFEMIYNGLAKIFDMTTNTKQWNDARMRDIMGTLLRVGVFSAAFLVVLGGILFFIQHPKDIFDFTTFKGEPAKFRQVHLIVKEAFDFRGRDVIQLGLLLLIATPVARVIFSLIGFLIEKDWIYVAITAVVLIVLSVSLLSNYLTF